MASVTVNLASGNSLVSATTVTYFLTANNRLNLGTLVTVSQAYLARLVIPRSSTATRVFLRLSDDQTEDENNAGPDFSSAFETDGDIILVASDGVSIIIPSPAAGSARGVESGDTSEPYAYSLTTTLLPSIRAFSDHIAGLTDKALTVTFNDNQNAAPVVTIQADATVVNGNGVVNLSGTVSDPDAVPDTIALALAATPDIGTFSAVTDNGDGTWEATWTAPSPTAMQRDVVLAITGTEPDENLTGTATVAVTVRQNQPPTVSVTQSATTIDSSDNVRLVATVDDPEGETVTVAWTSDVGGTFTAPSGLTTDFSITVTESTVASLTVRATDASGASIDRVVTVIIRAPATLPLMLPDPADMTGLTGEVVNVTLPEAMDGLQPYIYSATGLPTGLRFRNRVVQGIPLLPGTFTVTYDVTDSNQDMVEQEFTFTITGEPVPQPVGRNVRIDWGDSFYANPNSDVTGRITSDIVCERGRATASSILARNQAGALQFELQNSDGLFDEENPDSALAGLIRPGIQVQVRDGVTPIWTGVLESIPTQFEQSGQHRAQVTAWGIISETFDADVSGGSLTAESTAQAFIELCAKGEVPTESPQPQPGDAYVMRRWWLDGKLRELLNILEDTEGRQGGGVFEDKEGELGFHLGGYRDSQTVKRTFVTSTPGANEIRIVRRPRKLTDVKDVHNEVVGDVRQFEEKTGQTVFASADAIPVALGATDLLISRFPIEDGAVTELDAISGWTANTAVDGSGSDRTSQVQISAEVADFNRIRITVVYPTMTGTQADTLYIRGLTITGTVLTIGNPLEVTREDPVSKQRYRPKTLSLRDTWVRSPADMATRATAILALIASPERRFEVDWYVNDWSDFHALDLSDKVRIEMPTIESDGFIEAMRLVIPLSQVNPVCTLDVSLVD